LGGDEFAIVIRGLGRAHLLQRRVDKLSHHLQQDIKVQDTMYRPSASFGKVVYPDDAQSYEELLRAADLAMYRYKDSSKIEETTGHYAPGNAC
jgi:diguanylate cyclase (GGDEF)-like protein